MTQPSSPQFETEEREAQLALAPPAAPQSVNVRLGVRWVQVSWQPPQTSADEPVDDYLLAVSPGSQTIRFDAATTRTVLIALAPGQSYTVFVAARNDAGSSGWISSRPFELIYAAAGESEGSALLNAELFEDLLLLDDEALRAWLATTDDLDLELAIAATPSAQRPRILDCVEPMDRAKRLREQFAPPPEPQTAIVRYREIFQPPRPPVQPVVPRPEIVIEIPPAPRPRRRGLLWLGAAVPILILAIYLISAIPRWLPQPAENHLEGTVEALVAARMTDEAAPVAEREIGVTPAPAATLSTPIIVTTAAPAVYAQPAVDLLNVRSGPGEAYAVVETLPAGVQVALLERNSDGDWVYISAGRVEGWVASWLLTVVGDPQTLAVRATPPALASVTVATPEAATVTPAPAADEDSLSLVAEISAEPTPPFLTLAAPEATVSAELLASPCLMGGYFWLIHPIEITVYNQVTFHWGFSTPLPPECGFEVRVWRDGDIPRGVHDAVIDNQNGAIKSINGNEYQLDIPFMYNLPSVTGSAHYWWTVAIVQIEPAYYDFERQADPSRFYVDRIVR